MRTIGLGVMLSLARTGGISSANDDVRPRFENDAERVEHLRPICVNFKDEIGGGFTAFNLLDVQPEKKKKKNPT